MSFLNPLKDKTLPAFLQNVLLEHSKRQNITYKPLKCLFENRPILKCSKNKGSEGTPLQLPSPEALD